jgi:hypothetical protein
VFAAVPETVPQRYRVDEDSDVVEHRRGFGATVARNRPTGG